MQILDGVLKMIGEIVKEGVGVLGIPLMPIVAIFGAIILFGVALLPITIPSIISVMIYSFFEDKLYWAEWLCKIIGIIVFFVVVGLELQIVNIFYAEELKHFTEYITDKFDNLL